MSRPAQLALACDAAELSDADLADVVYDATMILEMGTTGIAPHVAVALRGRRLEAVRELVMRWERSETP